MEITLLSNQGAAAFKSAVEKAASEGADPDVVKVLRKAKIEAYFGDYGQPYEGYRRPSFVSTNPHFQFLNASHVEGIKINCKEDLEFKKGCQDILDTPELKDRVVISLTQAGTKLVWRKDWLYALVTRHEFYALKILDVVHHVDPTPFDEDGQFIALWIRPGDLIIKNLIMLVREGVCP
jgi:hypothetical protein